MTTLTLMTDNFLLGNVLLETDFENLFFVIAILILSIGGAIAEKLKRKLSGAGEKESDEKEITLPKPIIRPPALDESDQRPPPRARPIAREREAPVSPAASRPTAPARPERRPPPPPRRPVEARPTEPRPARRAVPPQPSRRVPVPVGERLRPPRRIQPPMPSRVKPEVRPEIHDERDRLVPSPELQPSAQTKPTAMRVTARPASASAGDGLRDISVAELRRAIVLNEVLGKPVALRDME